MQPLDCRVPFPKGAATMKQALFDRARSVRNWLEGKGLAINTLRGADHWHEGLELVWDPSDHLERAYICKVEGFGAQVLFFVRDRRDYIQANFLTGHFYAEEELRIIQKHYRGGTFLDIGANVGNHAIFAAAILKAPKVIAIEPNPDVYELLKINAILNRAEQIEHRAIALSDRAGTGSVNLGAGALNSGIAQIDEGGGAVPVRVGDEEMAGESLGFIKVDVEGMEMAVLRGLERTISAQRPPIMVEVHDDHAAEFAQFCARVDYRVGHTSTPYPKQTYYMLLPA